RKKARRKAYPFVISIHSKNVRPTLLVELGDSTRKSVVISCAAPSERSGLQRYNDLFEVARKILLAFLDFLSVCRLPVEAGCKGTQAFAVCKKKFCCFSSPSVSRVPFRLKRAAKVRCLLAFANQKAKFYSSILIKYDLSKLSACPTVYISSLNIFLSSKPLP
ncbi:hypothetical protein, partial [Hymenobacter sp. BT190]|uniref:hypothetical protein n=1 Tax=Hymenobacter sp. BT190 TaxID=2763505 RepID=UPI001C9DF219